MTSNFKHSRFAPSKMERRIACPGSAHIDNKDVPSKYAEEGTKAHEEAAEILQSNPVEIPKKLKYQIHDYLVYVLNLRGKRYIETRIALNSISEEIYGTIDYAITDWPDILHIGDLKYGAGKIVEVYNNAQLATYACGALERFGEDYKEVWITIVQPRIEHKDGLIRTWKTTPVELKKIWYPKIKRMYLKATKHPNLFKPGHHCRYPFPCTGIQKCVEQNKFDKAIVKQSEKLKIPENDKKLSKLLNMEILILEYFNQVKLEAFNRLREGQKIPGFKLVRNFGNTTWKSKSEAEKAFKGYQDVWEKKLWSIGKLKKMFPEFVDSLTYRPDKGLALVPESDKREAYRGAIDDFDDEMSE